MHQIRTGFQMSKAPQLVPSLRSEICFLCFPLSFEGGEKRKLLQCSSLGGGWVGWGWGLSFKWFVCVNCSHIVRWPFTSCHEAGEMGPTLTLLFSACKGNGTWLDRVHQITQTWGPNTKSTSSSVSFWTIPTPLDLYFPQCASIYLFLFTSDLFIFEFLHSNLLFHLVVYTLSQSCHTTDLSVSFFLHFSTSPLLLVWAVIQLVSGPVRQPVELICLFRS